MHVVVFAAERGDRMFCLLDLQAQVLSGPKSPSPTPPLSQKAWPPSSATTRRANLCLGLGCLKPSSRLVHSTTQCRDCLPILGATLFETVFLPQQNECNLLPGRSAYLPQRQEHHHLSLRRKPKPTAQLHCKARCSCTPLSVLVQLQLHQH